MGVVIDGVLSARVLRTSTDAATYAAAEGLVERVSQLHLESGEASAVVRDRARAHAVALGWSSGALVGGCDARVQGVPLCRHVVALGLAALDSVAGQALPAASLPRTPEPPPVEAELVAAVDDAVPRSSFLTYRDVLDVAEDVGAVLGELEHHLDAGRADLVLEPLRRSLTRLRRLTEHADDSAGVLGDACQRSADLYTRACREGHPHPVELARWFATFRATSPGWPDLALADVVAAFDARAMTAYRAAVSGLAAQPDAERRSGVEVDRMRLELADHDGDLDAAVDILASGHRPTHGAIIERLTAADRGDEALVWVDRAVADGRVSPHGEANDYWLSPTDVADRYLAAGRADDAIGVLRAHFARTPGTAAYRLLRRYAAALGDEATHREWALFHTRAVAERAGDGGVLVELSLADGDLDGAWAVADELGAGQRWAELAAASEKTDPARAAELHRSHLADLLVHTDTRYYPAVARSLVTMRRLYAALDDPGASSAFDDEIRRLREHYRRRSSMMKELDRAGLPR